MPIYHGHVFKCDFTHKNPYILSWQDKTCGTREMHIMLQTLLMQGNDFDHLMLLYVQAFWMPGFHIHSLESLIWVVDLKLK